MLQKGDQGFGLNSDGLRGYGDSPPNRLTVQARRGHCLLQAKFNAAT
jgi:hypothetical protein